MKLSFITSLFLVCIITLKTQVKAQVKQQKPNYLVLKNVTIIDVVSDNGRIGNIHVEGSKIKAIDYNNTIQIPDSAMVKDLRGKFIIPGLIDGHVHVAKKSLQKSITYIETALRGGITTVRDMGGDGRLLTTLKRDAFLGEIIAPDIYFGSIVAGQKFFDKNPRPHLLCLGAKAGEASWQKAINPNTNIPIAIAEIKGLGATGIKVYDLIDKKLFKKIAKEAKHQGLKVWSHATVPPTRPSELVDRGSEVLSHAGYLLDYEFIDEVKSTHDHKSVADENAYNQKINAIRWNENNKEVKNLFHKMKENNTILDATLFVYSGKWRGNELTKEEMLNNKAFITTKIAYKKGIKIGAGTDYMVDKHINNVNLHDELEYLAIAGLSNIDIIRAATIINAEIIGEEKNIGTIEVGKLANLVVLNANPLESISNTRKIEMVIKQGVIFLTEKNIKKRRKLIP